VLFSLKNFKNRQYLLRLGAPPPTLHISHPTLWVISASPTKHRLFQNQLKDLIFL